MLKITCLAKSAKLNCLIFSPIFFSSSSDSKNIDEAISSTFKRSKFKANQDLVGNVFFPDYEEIAKDHETRKIIKERKEDYINTDRFLLTSEEAKQISGNQEDKVNHPKNVEELTQLIKSTELNDKLLKSYVKYMRFFGRKEKKLLLDKLVENFNRDKEIRDKFQEREKRKLAQFKKINQNIEYHSKIVFLEKNEILNHYGFKVLLKSTIDQIKNEKYKPLDIVLVTKNFVSFYNYLGLECDQEFLYLFVEVKFIDFFFVVGNYK